MFAVCMGKQCKSESMEFRGCDLGRAKSLSSRGSGHISVCAVIVTETDSPTKHTCSFIFIFGGVVGFPVMCWVVVAISTCSNPNPVSTVPERPCPNSRRVDRHLRYPGKLRRSGRGRFEVEGREVEGICLSNGPEGLGSTTESLRVHARRIDRHRSQQDFQSKLCKQFEKWTPIQGVNSSGIWPISDFFSQLGTSKRFVTDHRLFKPHWISLLWFYWTYDRKIRSNLWKRDQTKYERPGQRRSLPTRWSARRRRREPYTDDAYMYWGGFSRNAASAATERARRIVPRGMSAGFAPGSTVLPAVKLCPTVTARFRRAAVEIFVAIRRIKLQNSCADRHRSLASIRRNMSLSIFGACASARRRVVVALWRVHLCAAKWDSSAFDGLRLKEIGHLDLEKFRDDSGLLAFPIKSRKIWPYSVKQPVQACQNWQTDQSGVHVEK